jgi:hypothetical protein
MLIYDYKGTHTSETEKKRIFRVKRNGSLPTNLAAISEAAVV